ncbi:MAG: serine hydrolase [Tissierellia bacterium]|nr:serine hydrolase [Tissierellia bacterium]
MKQKNKVLLILVLLMSILQSSFVKADSEPIFTPSGVNINGIESIVDNVMEEKIGNKVPGSAVVVVKDGKIVFNKGYGKSNLEADSDVIPEDTVFEIGSISKIFTWTAIMQLEEEGKLKLEDDIRDFIGYERLELEFDTPITIKDLMNHTAGFEENASEMMTFEKDEIISLENWVSSKHQPKQVYEPGTVIAYSNFSTDIAGYIIELVSGEKFEDYIENHILKPLGVEKSTSYVDYFHLKDMVENKSKGYGKAKNGFILMPENFLNEAPAGSIKSTSEDMGKFMIGLLNTNGNSNLKLFNKSFTLDDFFEDTLYVSSGMPSIAHGFWAREENGIRILEHGGNTTNFSAFISIVPEENFGVCILTNVANEDSGVRIDVVNKLIAEFTHNAEVEVKQVHSSDLSGKYSSGRMIHSNFLSSIYLVSGDSIKVIDNKNGEIEVLLEVEGFKNSYKYSEIEPLVFERTDSYPTYFDKGGGTLSHLKFELDDSGEVEKVRTGNIRDYIRIPVNKSFALNKGLLIFAAIVYVLCFVLAVIKFMRKKRRAVNIRKAGRISLTPFLINVLGIAIIINVVFTVMRFMSAMTTPIGDFKIHLILNIILMILIIVLTIVSLKEKYISRKTKLYRNIMIVSSFVLLVWLINYNYLAFWSI